MRITGLWYLLSSQVVVHISMLPVLLKFFLLHLESVVTHFLPSGFYE